MALDAVIEWTKGSLVPVWTVTVKKRDKSAYNLTGASFAGALVKDSLTKACTVGSYAISDAANGIFTYTQVAADVDMAGIWVWDTKITISTKPVHVLVRVVIRQTYA